MRDFYSNKHKQEYEEEPVYYCADCLSLNVLIYDEDTSYCGECTGVDIKSTSFKEWEKLYIEKYGKEYYDTKKQYEK